MNEKKDWVIADLDGLRSINERLVSRRGFGMLAGELYQNVSDTDATICEFNIEDNDERESVSLTVTDNGPGFARLEDAWTMFAPSLKKSDPTKAGRFNVGEKVVLSFCREATIHTTSGTVKFTPNGKREVYPRRKRDIGTEVSLNLKLTKQRFNEILDYMPTLLVRDNLKVTVNGSRIQQRDSIASWEETLQTEIGDDLRPTKRKTTISIYALQEGETPMLYELGIPVVETGDRWHVNIDQKIPLNTERDNVTPAYLKSVRVSVLNNMHNELTDEDTESTWVNEAASDKECSDDAVETFKVKKYGERSVAFDPANPEANAYAVSEGYTLIPSHGLTSGQRKNMKEAYVLNTSSAQFPNAGRGAYGLEGEPVEFVSDENQTEGMKSVKAYTEQLGKLVLGVDHLDVMFVRGQNRFQHGTFAACFSGGRSPSIHFNVGNLGQKWFDDSVGTTRLDNLIIHEFAHHYESNHLSAKYYKALSKIGAQIIRLVRDKEIE